jgi:hypothetical protein
VGLPNELVTPHGVGTGTEPRLELEGMEQLNGSTTHTVQIAEPPNRALRFLIGCAILYALWRCRDLIADFLTFRILNAFDANPQTLEATTVTGTVLPLLIELIIGLGGVGVFVFSLGWSVVVDLFAGGVATIAAFRARMTGQQIATAAATMAAKTTAANVAVSTAATAAGTVAGIAAGRFVVTDPQLVEFARLVQNTLREQRAELKAIAAEVAALKPPAAVQPAKPPRKRSPRGPQE